LRPGGVVVLDNLKQDLRYGIRNLAHSPSFVVVGVLTLALGIGANTAIFSVVENVLLRPLPYPGPQSLVEVWNTYLPQVPKAGLSPGDYADWARQNTSFSEMAAYRELSQGFNLTGEGEPARVQAAYGASGLFPMLGVRAAQGRLFFPEEDKPGAAPIVVLTHRFWQARFGGDPSVVGRTITLDNRRYTIAGVLPANFSLLRWPDLWMPLGQVDDDLTQHIHHGYVPIARLKPGVTLQQAQLEMEALNRAEAVQYPDTHKNFGVLVLPMQDPQAAKLKTTVLVLFGAVSLVLLIACVNIVNLLLVRNAGREREIAVRTALGAGQWRLARQLLTESTLVAFAGGGLGLLLAFAGLKALLALAPTDLSILHEAGLNGWVLLFTLAVCLLAGILCGTAPALRALKSNLSSVLKQGSKGASAGGHHRTHNLLVISEIAMALVPLVGAGLLLRSFQRLLLVDPGFRPDHLLTLEMERATIPLTQYLKLSPDEQKKLAIEAATKFEEIAKPIGALPGVKAVGGIDDLPLGKELRQASRFVIEGQPIPDAGTRPIAQFRTVSLGYFSTVGIPLRAGRFLNEDDWKLSNIVINETMAKRFWHGQDALGARINFCSLDPKPCWLSIVGIVGNVHQFGLEAEPTYDAYFVGDWTPYLVIRTAADPALIAAAATGLIHKADATWPVTHVMTMDELIADSVSPRRFAAVLTAAFGALGLLLAAIGVYGVISYAVSQRTQEIGIRMALGAQPGEVQSMILRHSTKLTLAGVVIGLAGAAMLVRFLSSLLFGIGEYDAVTFLGVPALLAGVAIGASLAPARRAVRVDPIVALRYE
jgi:putative ABC transport system permease protein